MQQNWMAAYSAMNLKFLMMGLAVTVLISVVSIILSFVIGSFLGIIRYSNVKYLSAIVGFIVDIIRNLPLLLIIFFTYFGLPSMGYKPGTITAAIMAMTVFESSMIAEIVRSGIKAVDPGQMEGARSVGMTYVQALWYIILPQAFKKMIPVLVSQFVSLIKDTSLATIIVVPELMQHAQVIYGQNGNYIIPMFAALAVLYFIICYGVSLIGNAINKRLVE